VPGIVIHFHFDQDVAREEFALGNGFLAALHFDDLFDRHQDAAKEILQAETVDPLLQPAHDTLLETRIGVNDVPALAHDFFQPRIRS